jgi:hypothetical protein
LSDLKTFYNKYPETLTADAGYGSEENYKILEDKNIDAYVKYNLYEKDNKKGNSRPSYDPVNMLYDSETDSYQCTLGRKLIKTGSRKRITENGYEQQYIIYQSDNCDSCPLKLECTRDGGNKTIEVNNQLNRYKLKACTMLNSEAGIYHRKRRSVDVEPVFGNIKHNKGFKRFNLRGIKKAEIEAGLLAIAHNLKKKPLKACYHQLKISSNHRK